ncbi:helix-turn-helix domain-containing protein [uncultured Acetatifactor sp.]
MGKALGISSSAVSQRETGSAPEAERLKKICRLM